MSMRVCKNLCVDTFQISDARIYKVSCSTEHSAWIDRRSHKTPTNKIHVTKVKEHIQSCSYKSYYTPSDTPRRRYLQPDT